MLLVNDGWPVVCDVPFIAVFKLLLFETTAAGDRSFLWFVPEHVMEFFPVYLCTSVAVIVLFFLFGNAQ